MSLNTFINVYKIFVRPIFNLPHYDSLMRFITGEIELNLIACIKPFHR